MASAFQEPGGASRAGLPQELDRTSSYTSSIQRDKHQQDGGADRGEKAVPGIPEPLRRQEVQGHKASESVKVTQCLLPAGGRRRRGLLGTGGCKCKR